MQSAGPPQFGAGVGIGILNQKKCGNEIGTPYFKKIRFPDSQIIKDHMFFKDMTMFFLVCFEVFCG